MSLLIENTEERSLYTPFRADFLQGVTSWRLWLFLGVYEVRRRYRRTIIGPFWNTISLAVFVHFCGPSKTLESCRWRQRRRRVIH